MDDQGKNGDSWISKLPKIIVILAVLIFIIIAFSNHNQYEKWKAEQSELTGKVKQTGEKLDHLEEASGTLQDVTKKVETLKQQAAGLTVAIEKLSEEKNSTHSALSGLRLELSRENQQLNDLNEQVSAGRNKVAELTKESVTLQRTILRLRGEIVNKKSVLDSIEFLQRQRPLLEQNILDLNTRYDLAAKKGLEQQARLEALQNKIKEGAAAMQEQHERSTALSNELAELAEAVKKLASQKENLAMSDDHQKKREYLENLQQQKEAMEFSINSLLQRAQMLEEKNLRLQQSEPTAR